MNQKVRAVLDALRAQNKSPDDEKKPKRTAFARTWGELATRLEVSRRMIQEWRNDPRYKEHIPPDRDDGRHDVTAWLQFMVSFRLARKDQDVVDEENEESGNLVQPPAVGGSERDWSKAERFLRVKKLERELQTLDGTLLVAAELELPLGATFVAMTNKLTQFPERVAPQVVGFSDVQEVMGILRGEIESDLRDLNAASYLEDAGELAFPFDEESAALMDAVSFGGQDAEKLRALIVLGVREVLRRVGRRVIEATRSGAGELLDVKTGQVTDAAEDDQRVTRFGPGQTAETRDGRGELRGGSVSACDAKGSDPRKRGVRKKRASVGSSRRGAKGRKKP
jgi:hypothetical protein